MFRRLPAIAVNEVLTLESYAVLDGDAATQGLDPLQVSLRDGLGVVEEPAQAVERHLPVHRLEDVQEASDRLVVGRVHAERPAVLGQQAHHAS